MADQVDVKIVTVDAVDNLAQLKKAIKDAKDNLSTLDLGSKKYQEQLAQVIEGQNLLRAAMNGTTATAEHLKDAIDKDGTSYNSLVNQMANLKREFRATTDEAKRAQLGAQIREINTELKQLDALKGDFQRNVGDYLAHDLKDVVKDLPSGLRAIKGPLDDVTKSMGLMGKQPILGIIGLLAPLINDIVAGIKDSESAMSGVKKMMDALKPAMDFFSGILQDIVEYVGDLIGQAANFLSSSGIFNQVIKGVMGVGNAILKFVVAPFKGVVEAIKVFKEKGVKGLGDAAKAFGNEMKNGVAFKENFQSGQAFADGIIAGAKSRKKEARQAGKEIGKEMGEGLMEGLDEILDKIDAAWNKKLDDRQKRHEQRQKDIAAYNKEQADRFLKEQEEEAQALAEEWYESEQKQIKDAQEAAEKKMAIMSAYASGTSDLLGSIADLIEAQGDEDEKTVRATKNLRIAAATIDMIQGAVTAFSTAQQLGPIAGPIVGAINAAAVVASGLANIAKIKSTNVSKDSSPSTPSVSEPSVQAPQLETAVPTTTVVEGASQEARLNRAASPSKVYILQSDIEAEADATKVQVAESSF